MNKHFMNLGILLALTLGAFSVQAHEGRYLGPFGCTDCYFIEVGWNNEDPPNPQAGVENAIDFIPTYVESDGTFVTLDTDAGDLVTVVATGIRLTTDRFNAPIVQVIPIDAPLEKTGEEEGFFIYGNPITPTDPGAHGFIVSGLIKKGGKRAKFFFQKFVCQGGSQDPEGSTFECVNP